jgi:hypothetical protein
VAATREEILARATEAVARDDIALAEALLAPLAGSADIDAMTLLGTALSLTPDRRADAERILRAATDAGSGAAAHNLATLRSIRGVRQGADQYYELAKLRGFEARVASDPGWWRR